MTDSVTGIYDMPAVAHSIGKDRILVTIRRVVAVVRGGESSHLPMAPEAVVVLLDGMLDASPVSEVTCSLGEILGWASRRLPFGVVDVSTLSATGDPGDIALPARHGHHDPQTCGGHTFDRVLIREALQHWVERDPPFKTMRIELVHSDGVKMLRISASGDVALVMGMKPEANPGTDPMPYLPEVGS